MCAVFFLVDLMIVQPVVFLLEQWVVYSNNTILFSLIIQVLIDQSL